ncbi:hypothetical protein II906_08230, partial [bacterium]|nr:hypothetical protein [bacterium]
MKISPINQNPNIKFKSKIKKVISGALTKSIADSVDIFEETHKNAKKLGSGLFATAYVLEPSGFVIKESLADNHAKAQNGCFYHEAKALAMIPPKMKQTQKLVALAQTEKDNYYLISTFIQGKSVRYPERPWSPHSFQSLFNVMFALDKEGIYHNDINQGNCLIDNRAEVNIIDYQFAEKFKIDDTRKNDKEFKTPYFMMPSNAQMFEMASLPWYFLSMEKTAKKQEIHDCFKTYLDIKSSYAQKRADYLASLGSNPQKTEYESLQAKFFKNPSEDMINLQAKKLQILYSFRKTFSIIDNNSKNDKNIASAVS